MTPIKNHQKTYKSVTAKNPKSYLRSKSLKMAKMAILGPQGDISGLSGQKWPKRHMNLWWNSALKRHYFRTDAEGKKGVKKRGSKKCQKFWRKKAQKTTFLKKAKKHPFWEFRGVSGSSKRVTCFRQSGVKRTTKSQHAKSGTSDLESREKVHFNADFIERGHFFEKRPQCARSFLPTSDTFLEVRPATAGLSRSVKRGTYLRYNRRGPKSGAPQKS